jgi:hypothetical protein
VGAGALLRSATAESLILRAARKRNWRKRIQFRRHAPARADQIRHKPFIDIKITFIFAEIADRMTFVEYAPYFWAQSGRMRQYLKNDVANLVRS